MFQFGPRDIFTDEYRQELERSPNVTLLTYAHALELETDDLAKTVTGVKVGALGGGLFSIAARIVILAQGGLESARLLLVSNSVQTSGLGNGNDLVGRYLMDHPVIRPGVLTPKDRRIMNDLALYDARWVNGARVIAKPILSADTQRQEQLLNINTAIFPRPAWARHNPLRMVFPQGQRPGSKAVASLRTLGKALKKGKLPAHGLQHFGHVLTGIDDLAYFAWRRLQGQGKALRKLPNSAYDFDHGGWSYLADKPEKFACFDLLHVTEQAPDRNNRITLSDDLDPFGYRRMVIHWRYNDIDRRSARRAMDIFAEEFHAAGLGTMRFELDHGDPVLWTPSIHHPMGTTRMHEDPNQGVVDENCQVHGISNLFIASSSVFPTGGYANPTLTILALALRVADHVKHEVVTDSLNLGNPAAPSVPGVAVE
jgi:choline dehydrogenase-like flavoprotein